MDGMLFSAGSLKDVLPVVELLTRHAGKSLFRISAVLNASLIVLGVALMRRDGGFFPGLVLTWAIASGGATLLFGWRRWRLESRVDEWFGQRKSELASHVLDAGGERVGSGGHDADRPWQTIVDEDGVPQSGPTADPAWGAPDGQRARDAVAEASMRDTWMPRIEAAQRSAIAAAGGIVNAPYLKDDLRVTLLAALATGACLPVGSLFLLLAVIALL